MARTHTLKDGPLRAAIYARNSRGGRSTEDQLAAGRRDCIRNEWVIVDEFEDRGISASRHGKKQRDDFQAMVAGTEAGKYDVLVAWETSRLQRDLEVYVRLRNLCMRNKVLWSLNGRVYDLSDRQDRFMTGLDAMRAEDEVDAIQERILRTTRESVVRGWMHGPTPFGFRREYDPDTGRLLRQVPDETTAPIVEEIVKRIAAGEACAAVAADLNRRGVRPSQRAAKWSPTVVRTLALNPTIIGRRSHRREDAGPAVWPAIVDRSDYLRAQAILADPTRKTTHERAVKHLLAGIAVCGVEGCGQRMIYRGRKDGPKYTCANGWHNTVRSSLLDAYVEEAVLQWLERADVAELVARRSDDSALKRELERAAEAEAELATARQMAGLPGGLSVASLAALEQNLLPVIAQAQQAARRLVFPAAVADMVGPDARAKWAATDDVLRKRALLKHVAVPTVFPGGRGVRTIRPGRVVLTWPLSDG